MANFIHITKDYTEQILSVPASPGKKALEPLKSLAKENGIPLSIIEDKEVDSGAEMHEQKNDLFYCIEGELTFICGGTLVDPRKVAGQPGEWRAKEIINGTEIKVAAGDWLWIPKGQPHQHRCNTMARLYVIKT